jgi:hypothetical protein
MSDDRIERVTPQDIEDALVAVVTALIREREIAYRDEPEGRVISLADLEHLPIPTRAKELAQDLVKHTLVAALECTLVELGKMAHGLDPKGEADLMLDIAERADARMGDYQGWLLDICSKRWDGIGDWVA